MENDGLSISKFLAQKPFSGLLLSFSNLKGTKPKQSATFEVSSGRTNCATSRGRNVIQILLLCYININNSQKTQ